MIRPEQVSAIVLAGGFSSRMGQDKAALRLDGKTLLERTAEMLQALGIGEVLISGHIDCPPGTTFVPDVYPHRGPLSGIHAGLLAMHSPCALVVPVDMPLLEGGTLRRLIAAHGPAPITVLSGEPMPGVFDGSLAPLCEQLLQQENHSLRRLFAAAGVQEIAAPGDTAQSFNCNTQEDFITLKHIILEKEEPQ